MRYAYLVVFAGSMAACRPRPSARNGLEKVDQALGKTGADQPGGVHRYGLPRTDLHVTSMASPSGRHWRSAAGSPSSPMDGEAMVMGDLVLAEAEINPVMSKLIANGIR